MAANCSPGLAGRSRRQGKTLTQGVRVIRAWAKLTGVLRGHVASNQESKLHSVSVSMVEIQRYRKVALLCPSGAGSRANRHNFLSAEDSGSDRNTVIESGEPFPRREKLAIVRAQWTEVRHGEETCPLSILLCSCILAQGHQHNPPDQPRVDLAKLPAPQHMDGLGGGPSRSQPNHRTHRNGSIRASRRCTASGITKRCALLSNQCAWTPIALCAIGVSPRHCSSGAEPMIKSKSELGKAKELSGRASDRDQRIIRAYAGANEKKGDDSEEEVSKALAILVDRYPDDVELRLLLARAADGGYDKGDASPGAIYSQAILRDILREHPDNAAANHYWIHAVEASDHPESALDSANKLGALAPASGHMVHMPGHIFYRMGEYERARQIFLAAVKVDEDYMAVQHVSIRDDWNYAHNLSYLVADCAEEGRYAEALEHVRSLMGVANDPDHSDNPGWYVMQSRVRKPAWQFALRIGTM